MNNESSKDTARFGKSFAQRGIWERRIPPLNLPPRCFIFSASLARNDVEKKNSKVKFYPCVATHLSRSGSQCAWGEGEDVQPFLDRLQYRLKLTRNVERKFERWTLSCSLSHSVPLRENRNAENSGTLPVATHDSKLSPITWRLLASFRLSPFPDLRFWETLKTRTIDKFGPAF
jgi:hypothetical protein